MDTVLREIPQTFISRIVKIQWTHSGEWRAIEVNSCDFLSSGHVVLLLRYKMQNKQRKRNIVKQLTIKKKHKINYLN